MFDDFDIFEKLDEEDIGMSNWEDEPDYPDTNIDLSVSPNGVMMAVGDGDHEWIRFESGEWSYESTIDTDEETETLNDLRE